MLQELLSYKRSSRNFLRMITFKAIQDKEEVTLTMCIPDLKDKI